MDNIQLLYVGNIVSGKAAASSQILQFFMRVANLGYGKTVEVHWAGEDGVRRTVLADYCITAGDGSEYWRAELRFQCQAKADLPGDIRFSLRLQHEGREYWDNNDGCQGYFCAAGSGGRTTGLVPVLNLSPLQGLSASQRSIPLKLAVDAGLAAEKVTVHWTLDDWHHVHKTSCRLQSGRRSATRSGYAGLHPVQHWSTNLKLDGAFRVQYSICCEGKEQTFWDNNAGQNYRLSRAPLKVMILNLHCYQEDDQDRKFWQIAKAVDELGADLVCLQEVAEHWNDGRGDWASNSANIINRRLKQPFHLYSDWSHLGFDKYREGVAILSRYPFERQEARYVSDSSDAYSIHSRKVVAASIDVPYIGTIDVFSAHLSWWEDGFRDQFQRLSEWADGRRGAEVAATLLCGDFNIAAGSLGYGLVVDGHRYEDQYLAANAPALFQQIFRVDDAHWRDRLADDYRIDYVFMNKDSGLRATSARVVFTEQDYGRVSDHCGYLLEFEPL
ncbi:endonuclease/exonuclease/phosphatase family protein [Methylomonas koyamae]|uniref:endonuclease/exonuclease/phosphatase family protein n=1 Tax=Methylomonas koyamae TaxID=702114 RepID=UPI0011299CD7|nr:endonuclease/exonuclease/phosphatase family protein [Methylomonas koyamae]TPQ27846.1 endonuclease [Methylomonas koyamae]